MMQCRIARRGMQAAMLALTLATAAGIANAARDAAEPRTYNDVPYLSGGVGLDEREEMRRSGDDYNLWLWFVLKGTPNYLAGVRVTIVDANGKPALDVVTEGPWLFARLPAGKFTVQLPDGTQRPVTVGAGGHTLSVIEVAHPGESVS